MLRSYARYSWFGIPSNSWFGVPRHSWFGIAGSAYLAILQTSCAQVRQTSYYWVGRYAEPVMLRNTVCAKPANARYARYICRIQVRRSLIHFLGGNDIEADANHREKGDHSGARLTYYILRTPTDISISSTSTYGNTVSASKLVHIWFSLLLAYHYFYF